MRELSDRVSPMQLKNKVMPYHKGQTLLNNEVVNEYQNTINVFT